MFYIHRVSCISPQQSLLPASIAEVTNPVDNQLRAFEPPNKSIPANLLRRMSKGVRISVAAAVPLLDEQRPLDGIIIGTANVGMQESGKFLNQIVEYNEDTLSPGNFVQSTSNSIASQISLMFGYTCYANTHVHGGLAFENAVIDAAMLVAEKPEGNFLLGGADEITDYNYAIDKLAGWYKNEPTTTHNFYTQNTPGSIAGEAAAMFCINGAAAGALAQMAAVEMVHSKDEALVAARFKDFIAKHLNTPADLLITGENGDNRLAKYYEACEAVGNAPAIARFKHLSGEYPTATSYAVATASLLISGKAVLPAHMAKRDFTETAPQSILIYNNYKGEQHSFMLIKNV